MAGFAEFSGFAASFYRIPYFFFTSSFFRKISSETRYPSPDSPEASGGNPFWAGVRPEKIGADSGKKLLIKFEIPIPKF